ncbi:hypothetical protein L1080_003955 [Rhodococcus sp. MSC1_016]|jgi:hypothetical protein|uniref:hypothetical protein n=1 Tax=Rhodococcus sp. MSC1_016 TaxID=2909266 RepID=UPI00202E9B29|nr:hypothetical protein [Rhodococcus sp. MSC1_016]
MTSESGSPEGQSILSTLARRAMSLPGRPGKGDHEYVAYDAVNASTGHKLESTGELSLIHEGYANSSVATWTAPDGRHRIDSTRNGKPNPHNGIHGPEDGAPRTFFARERPLSAYIDTTNSYLILNDVARIWQRQHIPDYMMVAVLEELANRSDVIVEEHAVDDAGRAGIAISAQAVHYNRLQRYTLTLDPQTLLPLAATNYEQRTRPDGTTEWKLRSSVLWRQVGHVESLNEEL